MERKTTEASTIKPAEKCESVKFNVNYSLEESEKYYRNAGFYAISDQLESLILYTRSLIQLKNTSSK